MQNSPVRHALALALFASGFVLAGAGCSGGSPDAAATSSDELRDCLATCAADPDVIGQKMCGTDGKTYTTCAWHCADVPKGVGVVPGACDAAGKPPAGGPPTPADGEHVCNWRNVDGRWIASACAEALKVPPKEALPVPIGPRRDAAPAPAPLPEEVDHRVRFGPAKNQGQAPSCTAFGTTAALESAIRSSVGEATVLSEMHLWSRYAIGSMERAAGAALAGGTATNDAATAAGMPYDDALALAWHDRKAEPSEAVQSTLDDETRFAVVGIDVLGNGTLGDSLVERMQRAIAEGNDVLVALAESDEWGLPDANGIISDDEFGERGGHAVLFVGYKSFAGRPYFLLRNSWGRGWGNSGYAYLSFDAAKRNVYWGSVIRVARKDFAEPKACPAGRSADLDNVCRVVCPNGALAGADDLCVHPPPTCTAGHLLDASGVCVPSCGIGKQQEDGYGIDCDDKSCTWTVDAGKPGCATTDGSACTKVCPAPLCDIAWRKDEFGRVHIVCSGRDL